MQLVALVIGSMLTAATSLAAVGTADTESEIQHLLAYIRESGCVFIRNAKEYDAMSAHNHILKKYRFLKRRIKSTDDFIRLAASQSSVSGKPYQVRCHQGEVRMADWLRVELKKRRQD
jgi:hypothetical protein